MKSIGARARRLELAINIKPLWAKRDKIDGQLEQFASLRPLEDGTLESLDDLKHRVEEHERQRDILRGQRHQLRDDAARLGINDLLVRNGQRLEALLEQVDWLQAVERQAKELGEEVKHLDARLGSENERLPANGPAPASCRRGSRPTWSSSSPRRPARSKPPSSFSSRRSTNWKSTAPASTSFARKSNRQ